MSIHPIQPLPPRPKSHPSDPEQKNLQKSLSEQTKKSQHFKKTFKKIETEKNM